jgi:hypothetical protein
LPENYAQISRYKYLDCGSAYLSGFFMMVIEILMHFEGFSHYFSLIQRISFNAQAHDLICLKVMLQFQETSTVIVDQLISQTSSS